MCGNGTKLYAAYSSHEMRRKLSLTCACLFIHMYTLQERLSRVYTDVL
jgi:hypothetical protein